MFLQLASKVKSEYEVVIVATCQQPASLNAVITESHIFDETVQLFPPTKTQRRQILEAILSASPALSKSVDSVDLTSIASSTEGYLPADLRTLVERAVHESAMRRMAGVQTALGQKFQTDLLVQQDFDRAQKDFVPSSLRGVKLQKTEVSWKDVGGLIETKRVLKETLEWPTKYAVIFANSPLRLRSGLLLYGYPGCGKTLLASAVAKECGLNFISVKGPELLNKYIGASEAAVRDLFERAQAAKPCVLFFDEFDSIAPRRGHDNTGVTDRVVNQLLTQMDGAEKVEGVYVLAATSRPDLIDPALLRPGRLDKSLLCGMPTFEERKDILQSVARKLILHPDVEFDTLAERSGGYSGADLQALLYNAHLEAIHELMDNIQKAREEIGQDSSKKVGAGELNGKNHVELEFTVSDPSAGSIESDKVAMTAAERGALSTRLETMQREMEASVARSQEVSGEANKASKGASPSLAIITTTHIESAFASTRPSLAAHEVRRLERIYDEFIGGRSTTLPTGTRATLA
ncbi:Peroxisome biosynthesis protein pex1 [Gonapodya sp. JEL0774]|nr:Peroxisome biosynthesis protein pex1 [Gonapodya sp. JEL0774]